MIRETPWRGNSLIRAAPIDELAHLNGTSRSAHMGRQAADDNVARLQRSIHCGRMQYVDPVFRSTNVSHAPLDLTSGKTWCGYVVGVPTQAPHNTPVGGFENVQANWIIPNVEKPLVQIFDGNGNPEATYGCATWVGLGGFNCVTGNLWQAGFTSEVTLKTSTGKYGHSFYAWFEIAPQAPGGCADKTGGEYGGTVRSVHITNFPVNPGDLVGVVMNGIGLQVIDGPYLTNAVQFSMTNWTRRAYCSFTFEVSDARAYNRGLCAEWIVERPGQPSPRFGTIYFDDAKAYYNRLRGGESEIILAGNTALGSSELVSPNPLPTRQFYEFNNSPTQFTVAQANYVEPGLIRCQYVLDDTALP
jgi:Peptidase A4 family